ncbi:HAD family hydrolase [Mariprofundus ferrooxydans]|uniref:HAD family hydrolase n=1 Tax=Mariprofundus ferrooxydans TaxID=314344 RepID=UPI00037A9F29|nr:HAD family hydrolase [Mariprofundus ferrooxydans]
MTNFIQNTIALIYDFDGTLSPKPMQEYTVLPKVGIESNDFWAEVNSKFREEGGESMLIYMRLLLEKAEERHVHIGKSDFAELAKGVEYFPGVDDWIARINTFVEQETNGIVNVEHYIISAGLKEILEGTSIFDQFTNVFASEYYYDHHDVPKFPKQLITDTSKTQFIFRINKGKQNPSESINNHMPLYLRPIPFQNMIYIGDGETDVPSMTVVKANGGNSIAVYKQELDEMGVNKSLDMCKVLFKVGRVNFIAPADYSKNEILEERTKILLKSIITHIEYEKERFECKKENGLLDEQGAA